jgi:ubiquinone/menaquinone biosynthesis C-methylase UbiE
VSQSLPSRILSVILKIFFSLLYHQFAWSYDAVAWLVSFGRWQGWILSTLPYLTGDKILEIGHGPGHLQKALFAVGKQPIGIDESYSMNSLASRRLTKAGKSGLIINGYAQYMSFSDNAFDQVVATFPTEYIFEPTTLSEIRRVLTPGGMLVVLPIALIIGKSGRDRALAWLFRLTRQAPAHIDQNLLDNLAEPFNKAGFFTTSLAPIVSDSQLVIILAQKPAISSQEYPLPEAAI